MSKLIIDATHLCNRCFHIAVSSTSVLSPIEAHTLKKLRKKSALTEEEKKEYIMLKEYELEGIIGFTAHTIINSIVGSIKQFPSDEVILAWDKSSWRYKAFPAYKADRKKKREESTPEEAILRQLFYSLMDKVMEIIGKTNVLSIKLGQCEADDIAAVITMKSPNERIVLVTSDSDFQQLMSNPNVRVYDPVKKKQIRKTPLEAKFGLFEKLIRGDSSDSIPSSYPRLFKKKMQILFDNPIELAAAFEEKEGFKKKFKFNELLIDFNKIPNTIQNVIWKEYQIQRASEDNIYKLKEWVDFAKQYKLKELVKNLDVIRKHMY